MPDHPDFTWGMPAAPIWFDPRTRRVSTTLDHVDPALKVWIERLWGTGEEETALVRELEATVAAGQDTAAVEAKLVTHYQAMGVRV